MDTTKQRSIYLAAARNRPWWYWLHWPSAGIRTKILVPLALLMTLSLLGGIVGFIVSTDTTRNRILDTQIETDANNLRVALEQSNRESIEAARLLSQDDLLIAYLQEEQRDSDSNLALQMSDRVVPLRDRFGLDQVIVLNAGGEPRVNIGPSLLENITIEQPDLLPACSTLETALVQFNHHQLLVVCAPITPPETTAPTSALLGDVYAVFDIRNALQNLTSELGLESAPQLVASTPADHAPLAPGQYMLDDMAHSNQTGFRERHAFFPVGGEHIQVALRIDERPINEILNSGLSVMLISSGITLLLLLAAGTLLAQALTLPLLKLSRVADAVAAGDLSARAHLHLNDEIGRMGRSFDQATETIVHLLDQQARAASERQAILQSIADGVLAVDLDERILVINPAAAELLGQDDANLTHHLLGDIINTDDPALLIGLEHIVRQIRSEMVDPDLAPTEEHTALGSRIVRIHSTPTLVEGKITGAVVVLQDITRVVEADRAKSEFIATASHELRTPLTSLKGFVDVFTLSGTENLSRTQQMFLETINRQTNTMVQLVNDLLEVARLEQGKQRTERTWVQVATALDDATVELQPLARHRSVALEKDVADNIPPLWIDALHLRRILTNLISNGIKYVHSGGQVTIHIYELNDATHLPGSANGQAWPHHEEASLVIVVEDNGVGIREGDQPKIFTRFFRSENPLSVEVGGTGLGLAVTKSLVTLHAGQIGFRSIENEGSCFWVRFPITSTEPLQHEQST